MLNSAVGMGVVKAVYQIAYATDLDSFLYVPVPVPTFPSKRTLTLLLAMIL